MADIKEMGSAIKQICEEKGIAYEAVIESIESALAVAYRKEMGQKGKDIRVEFNPSDASMRVFEVFTVVENELYEEYVKEQEAIAAAIEAGEEPLQEESAEKEAPKRYEDTGEIEEPKPQFNPKTNITLAEALEESDEVEVGDEIRDELEVPGEFGRMAAQTAKQVIIQKLREAERETLFNVFKDRAGEIINGMVQRVEGRVVFVDLGQAVAVMPPSEQIRGEVYKPGQRIKVLLLTIEKTNRGPEIVASRSHPDLVAALFRAEVPEIESGIVEIKGIAREAGSRTKIAVTASDPSIDPIGSCVGQRGTRVQTVINELGGEKIDIIEYQEDPVQYIVQAMSPAKIVSVTLNEEESTAVTEVVEDQFSLAIGKSGQNVRLASRLSGWNIDVQKAEGEGSDEDSSEEHSDDNESGDSSEPDTSEDVVEETTEAPEVATAEEATEESQEEEVAEEEAESTEEPEDKYI